MTLNIITEKKVFVNTFFEDFWDFLKNIFSISKRVKSNAANLKYFNLLLKAIGLR